MSKLPVRSWTRKSKKPLRPLRNFSSIFLLIRPSFSMIDTGAVIPAKVGSVAGVRPHRHLDVVSRMGSSLFLDFPRLTSPLHPGMWLSYSVMILGRVYWNILMPLWTTTSFRPGCLDLWDDLLKQPGGLEDRTRSWLHSNVDLFQRVESRTGNGTSTWVLRQENG